MISVVMELYQLASLQGFGTDTGSATAANKDTSKKELDLANLLESRTHVFTQVDQKHEIELLAVAGVSLLLLFQNVYFCYRTTVDAAKAYETVDFRYFT